MIVTNSGLISSQSRMLPLDFLTPSTAVIALSTRRINSSYTGPAGILRRSGDNATTTVYFSPSGAIDLLSPVSAGGTLSGWISTNSISLSTLYDQSGYSNDGVQTTAGSQAVIAAGGNFKKINNKTASFYSGSYFLSIANSTSINLTTDYTSVSVISPIVTSTKAIFDKRASASAGYHVYTSAGVSGAQWNSTTTGYNMSVTSSFPASTANILTVCATFTANATFFEGVNQIGTPQPINGTGTNTNTSPLLLGGHSNDSTLLFNGYMGDFILLNTNMANSSSLKSIVNNMRNYWGVV